MTGDWLNALWYIHPTEYCAFKKKDVESYLMTWKVLHNRLLNEIKCNKQYVKHNSNLFKSLKNWVGNVTFIFQFLCICTVCIQEYIQYIYKTNICACIQTYTSVYM